MEVSSDAYPSLERVPGKQNWVDAAGGLPSYIERIAKHLHYEKGFPISTAIAIAVNTVKRWARAGKVTGGGVEADAKNAAGGSHHVTPATQAKAAAAVAEWEAKKGKAKAKAIAESVGGAWASPDELDDLLAKEQAKLTLYEGVRHTLTEDPRALAVANARSLFGSRGEKMNLEEAGAPAQDGAVEPLLERLNAEIASLSPFVEMLREGRGEKKKTPLPKPPDEKDATSTRSTHLQRRLSSLGFDAKDDGQFGPKTEAEVKSFQHHAGLKEDGVVGEKTKAALQAAPAPGDLADPDTPTVADAKADAAGAVTPDGDTDTDDAEPGTFYKGMGIGNEPDEKVKSLQLEIEELGYPNIDVDGRFGPKTEQTVKRFQSKMGLKSDGIVGPKTKKTMTGLASRLNEAIDRRLAAPPAEFPAALAAEREIRRRIEEGTKSGIQGGGAMKRCPSCGWKMKPGTTKCGKCGAKLRKKGDANVGSSD